MEGFGSIQKVVFDGILNDFGDRVHVHLLEDSRPVCAHCVGTEEELLGDFSGFLS